MTYSSGFTRVNECHPIKAEYYFFKHAILSSEILEIEQLDTLNRISISQFALKNVKDCSIMAIIESCDLYCIIVQKATELANNFEIEWFFDFYQSATFHKFYLKHFQYDATHIGLESSLCINEILCEERTTDKMIIYDMADEKLNIVRMLLHNVYLRKLKTLLPSFQYKLRMRCNNLLYVMHTYDVCPNQSGKQLSNALLIFRTTIVATITYSTVIYKETSSTECLTFMKSIKRNHTALHLGSTDDKNDVFVDESNYLKKPQECLGSKDRSGWKKIACRDRKYIPKNLSNDNSVEKLVNAMCKTLGEKNAQV